MKIKIPRCLNANAKIVKMLLAVPTPLNLFTLTSPPMSLTNSLPSSAELPNSFGMYLRCLPLALVALLLGLALPLRLSPLWDLSQPLLPLSNLPLALDPAPVLAPLLLPLCLLSRSRCHLLLSQMQPRPFRPANPWSPL